MMPATFATRWPRLTPRTSPGLLAAGLLLFVACLVACSVGGLTDDGPVAAGPLNGTATDALLSPAGPAIPSPETPSQNPEPYPYGVVYAYEKDAWSAGDRQAIRAHLAEMKRMGVNTIMQTFSSRLAGTPRETDWLILLDEAESAGIGVITRLWPLEVWNGHSTDFPEIEAFLAVVGDHPALVAYLGLHEPLELYTSTQMRRYYTAMKQIAPDVPLAHLLGNMSFFDEYWRFPNRRFTAGICDVCIVWCTPARYLDGEPYLDEAILHETVETNRALIDTRSPESELWFLGQAYALDAHRHQLRMPEPEEMDLIFRTAVNDGVDGFLWYPWLHGAYDQVLSDDASVRQQQAVRTISDRYLGAGQAGDAEPLQLGR